MHRSVRRPLTKDLLDPIAGIAPAALLPWENEQEYTQLSSQIAAAAKPRDFIEQLLTRDVVDLTREIFRLRRLKVAMLRTALTTGVARILKTFSGQLTSVNQYNIEAFSGRWALGDPATRELFTSILSAAELTMDDVAAEAFSIKISQFDRLDRMLAGAKVRRTNALQEIDRHRDVFGAAVRQAIEKAGYAEFKDVASAERSKFLSPWFKRSRSEGPNPCA